MMKMQTLAVLAAAFAVSAPAFADSKSKLDDVLSASGVTVSGHAEAGYDYANTSPGTPAPRSAFFNEANSFVLHQVGLNIAKAPTSGFGGAVTLLGGEDAKKLSNGGDEIMLLQGYVSYTAGAVTVIGGRFLTLAGAEVIDSSANFNSSRGALWGVQPTYLDGVRATYKVSNALSVSGGVMNSRGQSTTDNNANKAVELNATFVAGTLTNSLTAYISDEGAVKGAGRDLFVDYVGTLALTPTTTLALNVDYNTIQAVGKDDSGYGVAGYVNQKLDATNRVALRAEYLHDNQHNNDSNTHGVTVTFGHALASNFEVTAEARIDQSGKNAKGVYLTEDSDTQLIGSVRAVYKF